MGKYVAEGVISEAGSSLLWGRHSNPGIARSGRSKAGIPVREFSHIGGRLGNQSGRERSESSGSASPKWACGRTMEREYQPYCDRCGQCLDWSAFSKTTMILPQK